MASKRRGAPQSKPAQGNGWAGRAWRTPRSSALALHAWLWRLPAPVLLTALGCMALAASSDLANSFDAPRRGGPLVASALFVTLLLAFALFLLATRRESLGDGARRLRPLRLLAYPALLWALFTAAQTPAILIRGMERALTVAPPRYGSDDLYYNHYNAWLVLHGENPYAGPWLADETRYFDSDAYTPIRRGRFGDPRHYPTRAEMDAVVAAYVATPQSPPPELDPRTTHSYPAGAFLVNLPVVWAGAPSVAVTQILALLTVAGLIAWAAPPGWRLAALALALTTTDGARQVTGGDFEIWPLAFLVGVWLTRERRWAPGLLLGAACAIKQTAWLAAPFYLLWVWRARGWREALRQGGVAIAAFLLINLPWIVASPGAWLASLALPVSLPLLPDGSGVVGLSLTGVLPLFPAGAYSALEALALLAALLWYWRAWRRFPYAGLILPLLPLVFAWRSSERYFVLLPLAALLALALTLRDARRPAASQYAESRG